MLILYIIPLLVSFTVALALAIAIYRFRSAAGAPALLALSLAAAIWSAGYALEIISPTLELKIFWAKVQYFGITAIPLAWFLFSITYLGSPRWLASSLPRRLMLVVIPAITIGLVWTNERHGFIWRKTELISSNSVWMLLPQHGAWFWLNWIYSYILLLVGSIWLASRLLGSNRLHRWQIGVALAAILVPWIGNLFYVAHLGPVPDLDWTPFAFTAAGLLFAISLFRFYLVQIIPIAHKTVVEDLPDGIMILDLQDHIVDLNHVAEKIVNLPGARLVGQPIAKVLPELAPYTQLREQCAEVQAEITQGRAGSSCTYELHISPLLEREADPVGCLVVLHDITDRKQQQALLENANAELEKRVLARTQELLETNELLRAELAQRRLAENRFQTIVNSSPDALILVDPQGQIILSNTQVEQTFGYLKDELYNQNIELLIPARFHSLHRAHLSKFFADPKPRPMGSDLDLFAQNREGREFPVEILLSPLKISEGILAACVIRDIGERKRAEAALKESEATFRALFENANDPILLVSIDGTILDMNQKAADLLGYIREELAGRPIQDILAPGEILDSQEKREALLSGQTLPLFERYMQTGMDSIVPVEVNLALVLDSQGKPRFFQGIFRDITGRKLAEQEQARLLEEVRQSQEQLRALTARLQEVQELERRKIAIELHDRVGQNLTGLNLNLQLVQNGIPPEFLQPVKNRLEDSLALVEETTRHVRNVMVDLYPPQLDEYGLVAALRWYGSKFSERMRIRTVVIGDHFEPRLPPRIESVLFRIVQEALNNVVKHAQATEVTILVESIGEAACLAVEDNGVGFDPSAMEITGESPHWGLFTMQERAASIGGQLTIHSEPGKGTCLSVEIRRNLDAD